MPPIQTQTIEARLVYDPATDCVFMEVNGVRTSALWPPGYGCIPDQEGVQSPDGRPVALIGQFVRLRVAGPSFIVTFMTIPAPGVTGRPPAVLSCTNEGGRLYVVGIE